jgi:hypothetical protein
MNRPAKIALCPTPVMAVAWIITPRMKTKQATNTPYFLDNVSAKNPESSVPNQAPSSKIAVSQPFNVELVIYSPISAQPIKSQYHPPYP